MKRQKHGAPARIALTILASTLFAASAAYSQQAAPTALPQGTWTFSSGPYSGPDATSLPVDVYSVTTEADKGLLTTSVSLHNRTAKDVAAVKLRWILKDTDSGNMLLDGETGSVGVAVAAGKRQVLRYPVVSFAKIARTLAGRSPLKGNYRLEILVSEVTYADETARKIISRRRAKLRHTL